MTGKRKCLQLAVAAAALLAFAPVLRNGFVGWDDEVNFLRNPQFLGLSWHTLAWAWKTRLLGVYQPLAWMLLSLQSAIFGLEPGGYHLVSVLLHAANSVLLFELLAALAAAVGRPSLGGSAVAAILFAVHPLRTEAVAWASCQPYLLCAFFYFSAILLYLRRDPARGLRGLVPALALFVAAGLSKAAATSLPLVLLVLDVYPGRRIGGPLGWRGPGVRAVWREKVPFFILGGAFALIAVFAKESSGSLARLDQVSLMSRIAQAGYGIWFYPVKTLLPTGLCALYSAAWVRNWTNPVFGFAVAGALVASAALFARRREWPGMVAAWFGYLAILAPSSGLIRAGGELVADRYSYLASAAGAALAGPILTQAAVAWRRRYPSGFLARVRWLTVIAVAGALVILSWFQAATWSSSELLWKNVVTHGGDGSAKVHHGLGRAYAEQGKLAEAAAEFREAIRIYPGYAEARNNLGTILGRQGRVAEAEAEYARSLEIEPEAAATRNNWGTLLAGQGRIAEAAAQFERALGIDPAFTEARYNLGTARAKQGRLDEGIALIREALKEKPDEPDAHYNLGAAYLLRGRPDLAEAEFNATLRIRPGDPDARAALTGLGRRP